MKILDVFYFSALQANHDKHTTGQNQFGLPGRSQKLPGSSIPVRRMFLEFPLFPLFYLFMMM